MYAVIGTSAFVDNAVAVGPYRTIQAALTASYEVEYRGYVAEIVTLDKASDISFVTNDEGQLDA